MNHVRFPGYTLSGCLREADPSSTSHQDLSSFNINLGDFGQARLVASLAVSEARIHVSLTPVPSPGAGDKINIECSLLVIDQDANLLQQVRICRYLYKKRDIIGSDLYRQMPSQSSCSPASSDTSAAVSFSLERIDVTRFSLIIIPTSLHVTDPPQCLVNSAQTLYLSLTK